MKFAKLKITKLLSLIYLNIVRILKWTEFYQPTYNPKNFYLYKNKKVERGSRDRIEFIEQNINFSEIKNFLDIGSQLGYFIFEISKNKNIIAQGIEMNYISWAYSNSIAALYQKKNVSFMKSKLTSSLAEKLPNYDVISFLSVFHHIVHFEGFEEADKIMKNLAKKCKYFIFETGQFNEKNQYWTEKLNFMGDNSKEWLKKYLTDLGYEIATEKKFTTHLNDQYRSLFICKKTKY